MATKEFLKEYICSGVSCVKGVGQAVGDHNANVYSDLCRIVQQYILKYVIYCLGA